MTCLYATLFFRRLPGLLVLGIVFCAAGAVRAQTCNYITLSNQAQVDAFNCTKVTGYLTISGSDITNLDGLAELTSVGGLLHISNNNSLTNLDGLAALSTVGGNLVIQSNSSLKHVDGLSALSSVGEHVFIISNDDLMNVDGLATLGTIEGSLDIISNGSLTNVDGLSSLSTVGESLNINSNSSLGNVNGLSSLSYVGGFLNISSNSSLVNVDGLSILSNVGAFLRIESNSVLVDVDGLSSLSNVGGYLLITSNSNLANVNGLSTLNTVGSFLSIFSNGSLKNIDGLSALSTVGGYLNINSNSSLANLNGLATLSSVGGYLRIAFNNSLTNLDGLSTLSTVGGYLIITYNSNLIDCCAIHSLLTTPGAIGGTITINNNATGCDSESEIEVACGNAPPTAVCRALTVDADANCQGAASAQDFDGGSTDPNEDELTFSISPEGPYALGTTNVTLTVSDGQASSTCETTFTVEDHTPPAVTCSGGTVTFQGEEQIAVAGVVNTGAADNCGVVNGPSFSPTMVSCAQVGQQVPVIVSYTDADGNMGRCTTSVQVNGLPCGMVDPGGIGCNSQASYSAGTFTLQTNDCNPNSVYMDEQGSIGYQLCGNGSISFRVAGLSSANAFAGIQLRADGQPGAVKAEVVTNRYFTARAAVREYTGAAAWPSPLYLMGRHWLKLERWGNQIRIYTSANGYSWTILMVRNLTLPNCVYVGMVTYGPGAVTATFDNVQVNGAPLQTKAANVPVMETNSPVELSAGFRLRIYPNPTTANLTVELPEGLVLDGTFLQVIDLYGRVLLAHPALDYRQQLDLRELPVGTYLLRVQADGSTVRTERIVVVK